MLLGWWFLFYFSLCICYTVCPFPPYNCVSEWPAYHLYLEICFLSELGENVSCGVLSQPAFSKILLLPLVVVTGIFLKNKSLHFSYQEYLWAESMQWRSFTEPCPCLWYVFFPLCWVSAVLDVKSGDCGNRLHFRLIKVLLIEAFIALNQICKSNCKLEPPFL